jgi:hypothetical protein
MGLFTAVLMNSAYVFYIGLYKRHKVLTPLLNHPASIQEEKVFRTVTQVVLLPVFQKCRDIKEKGSDQFWPKKGNLRRTRKNGQNFTPFSFRSPLVDIFGPPNLKNDVHMYRHF